MNLGCIRNFPEPVVTYNIFEVLDSKKVTNRSIKMIKERVIKEMAIARSNYISGVDFLWRKSLID